jgi:transcriptional regulator GlxA family with amidase domain
VVQILFINITGEKKLTDASTGYQVISATMPSTNSKPLSYACVLFSGFQLLDAAGPIDILSFKGGARMTMLAETSELVSTKSEKSAASHPSFGIYMKPSQDYASFLASDKTIDVLIIPGGIGTRDPADNCDATRDFIRQIAPRITTAIITICTGSDLLASTGLLDNQSVRATTNVARFEHVSTKHANRGIEWLHKVRWVKSAIQMPRPLEIWSSAGVSAGMDVTLAFAAEKYGREEAVRLAQVTEIQWRELASGQQDPMYDEYPL